MVIVLYAGWVCCWAAAVEENQRQGTLGLAYKCTSNFYSNVVLFIKSQTTIIEIQSYTHALGAGGSD